MKYHVNPKTGLSGACSAKEGRCPYGGSDLHFDSYEEAVKAAEKLMEEEYFFIDLDSPMDDVFTMQLKTLSESEQFLLAGTTKDTEFLDKFINEDFEDLLGFDLSYNLKLTAAMNSALNREIIEDAKRPEVSTLYPVSYCIALAKNRGNTTRDIVGLVNSVMANEGRTKKELDFLMDSILTDVRFREERLREIYVNGKRKGMKYDPNYFSVALNPNCPDDLKAEVYVGMDNAILNYNFETRRWMK